MDELPDWPEGTPAVLSTLGGKGALHAIPVSLALKAAPRELLIGLAPRRRTLELLRADPACAVTVMAAGLAFTAHGRAVAFEEAAAVIAVRVAVDRIADHDHPTFAIDDGVRWRWRDAKAVERDAAARAALRELP